MSENDRLLFVSHVAEDRAAALEIVSELERRGVKCWVAPRDVHPGQPFDDEIVDAIETSRAMLLVFSDRCNSSEYIRREVTVAGESHKVIIPFRIEDVPPRRGLRVRLSDLHWIDGFVEREKAIEEVTRHLGGTVAASAKTLGASGVSPPASETHPSAIAEPPPTMERNKAKRRLLYGFAGIVLVVIGSFGGALYYKNYLDGWMHQSSTLNPQQIAERFGNSTVWVQMQWRLYDRETGKPLYHKTVSFNGGDLPAYVNWNGHIYRWLTTEDEYYANFRVGAAGSGSGFIVSDDGLILTNKHVAAGWEVNYNAFSNYERGQGVLYTAQPVLWNDNDPKQAAEHAAWRQANPTMTFDLSNDSAKFRDLVGWQPAMGGPVFANDAPIVIRSGKNAFEGRNDELSVRFPGSRVDAAVRLLRASSDADVALVKIDTSQRLATVNLARDDHVGNGEMVTVLGYPAFSGQTPNPTVTIGNISNISEAMHQAGDVTTIGTVGDTYRLSLPSDAGNGGGPVFDAKGDVIGLLTYESLNQTVTYAVPIHYARDLIQLQKL